jgi:hypothetical protein
LIEVLDSQAQQVRPLQVWLVAALVVQEPLEQLSILLAQEQQPCLDFG